MHNFTGYRNVYVHKNTYSVVILILYRDIRFPIKFQFCPSLPPKKKKTSKYINGISVTVGVCNLYLSATEIHKFHVYFSRWRRQHAIWKIPTPQYQQSRKIKIVFCVPDVFKTNQLIMIYFHCCRCCENCKLNKIKSIKIHRQKLVFVYWRQSKSFPLILHHGLDHNDHYQHYYFQLDTNIRTFLFWESDRPESADIRLQ